MALEPLSFVAVFCGATIGAAALGGLALTTIARWHSKGPAIAGGAKAARVAKAHDKKLASALAAPSLAEELDPLAAIPDDFYPAEAREVASA